MDGGVENAGNSAWNDFPKLCVTGEVDSRQECLVNAQLAAWAWLHLHVHCKQDPQYMFPQKPIADVLT